jgi:hypothetical protein
MVYIVAGLVVLYAIAAGLFILSRLRTRRAIRARLTALVNKEL